MADNFVVIEPATVFRVQGRRYFTKRSAFMAIARQWVKERCECEKDAGYGEAHTCKYHDPTIYPGLLKRLTRLAPKYVRVGNWP